MVQKTFCKLPDTVWSNIIRLLPQQDKANVARTNFHFYKLVQPLLYENLLFAYGFLLDSKSSFNTSRWTIIGSSRNPLVTKDANEKLISQRQDVLLQSLKINKDLCQYVHRIVIYSSKKKHFLPGDLPTGNEMTNGGSESEEIAEPVPEIQMKQELLHYLKTNCFNLQEFCLMGSHLDNITNLSRSEISKLKYLKRLDIDDLSYLPLLHGSKITNLVVNHSEFAEVEKTIPLTEDEIDGISNLDTLSFNSYGAQSQLIESILQSSIKKLSLKTLKIIYYHGYTDTDLASQQLVLKFFQILVENKLRNLEIVFGCDHMTCNCMQDFTTGTLNKLNFPLEKLSVIQHTVHEDHNYSEKFDYYLSELVSKIPCRYSLKYLAISYDVPGDFNIGNSVKGNGIKGNFLKRKRLFEATLPKLPSLETLILPHFLENAACYEQIMSDALWNGCKCEHCTTYLSILDYYVMHHQYYDSLEGYMRDMIAPMLFGSAGRILSKRDMDDSNLTVLSYPEFDTYWDFHSGNGISHFKGSDEQCDFNESCFRPFAKCISHFFLDYVHSYGSILPGLKHVSMNGELFERSNQNEKNWTSIYD